MIAPRGPFSLAAALRFLDRFAPAGTTGQGDAYEGAHVVAGEPALVRVAELDAELLRAMEPDAARQWLERSPGIGPWSSAFVLIRGVGFPDLLPTAERRLAASVAEHYELAAPPDDAELAAIAAVWAPFRAWAAFLLRVD